MIHYTVKLDENKGIYLINEQQQVCPCLTLLKDAKGAQVFALDGSMGVGKTTFVKQLLKEMGSDDIVNSPTFSIINMYDCVHNGQKQEVYHFDCYRLKDIREAMDFGAEEYLYSGNYCFIEWPQIIKPMLPNNAVWVKFAIENGERILTIKL